MTLTRLPNAERLLVAFFLADPDVSAVQGGNVFTEIPKGFTGWPATLVTRVGGTPAFTVPLLIDQPLLQVSVFGGPKSLALDIAETQRAALVAPGRLPLVLAGVGQLDQILSFGGLRDIPDYTWDPARPRWIWECTASTRAPAPS